MVYEHYDARFDIEKLRQHLREHVLKLEATYQSQAFGGWSVLSSDGTIQDGWQKGHLGMKQTMTKEELVQLMSSTYHKPLAEYVVPTEICHGYLLEIIEKIKSLGLSPRRARIIKLAAGLESVWHRDSPENTYAVRLHVPIITNPHCFFETETERAHLTADGSAYFLHVNRMHRVVNGGTEDRYHLVMNIVDKNGVTKHHRWTPSNLNTQTTITS